MNDAEIKFYQTNELSITDATKLLRGLLMSGSFGITFRRVKIKGFYFQGEELDEMKAIAKNVNTHIVITELKGGGE